MLCAGEKGDVGEVLGQILDALELIPVGRKLVHECFALETEEVSRCANCLASTSHDSSTVNVVYANAQLILDHFHAPGNGRTPPLGTLLRSSTDEKSCSKCDCSKWPGSPAPLPPSSPSRVTACGRMAGVIAAPTFILMPCHSCGP